MAILDNIRNVMNKVIRIVCILLFAFIDYYWNLPDTCKIHFQ